MNRIPILYIHGMGGGGDSRIPSILKEYFPGLVVMTYSFNPDEAQVQLKGLIEELHPKVIVGESLGSVHALTLHHIWPELPVVLVSPALNAPKALSLMSYLTLIPGVPALLGRIYRPRPGDRQKLVFRYSLLSHWNSYRKSCYNQERYDNISAFFGTRDHYRRSGIVSLRNWKRNFPESACSIYEGSHFMEEKYVRTILRQKISSILQY